MSKGSDLNYRLRPNKAVDRELFLSLLGWLAGTLKIENYQYVGLGGPFLEEFRLLHARLGIQEMVCVESNENVHLRQKFNRPIPSVDCVLDTLEEYLDSTEFEKPVIIWFDFTEPRAILEQINAFTKTILNVPANSILRITLNSNPSSLGEPKQGETITKRGKKGDTDEKKPTVQEWRLQRFRERLGRHVPNDLSPDGMTKKNFGNSVLHTLHLAVEDAVLQIKDRDIFWALATHYADGQSMVTATLIVISDDHNEEKEHLKSLIEDWCFSSSPKEPLKLDMPALSTIERLTMEADENPKEILGYDLPKSTLGEDPFDMFRKFYRVYPHFARIDL